jgi:hydroxymethylglutaryl-CoA lyase
MPSVTIVEVSPRDGLQNENVILSTDAKVELINRLVAAGARRIEAVSFAHPRLVPAMADAEAVMERVSRHGRSGPRSVHHADAGDRVRLSVRG